MLAAVVALVLFILLLGRSILVANDPPRGHVDAAVVLQGSIAAEKARIAGAVELLRRGTAGRVLISVPKESYWGQSIPPIARAWIEREYGNDFAARVDFCETGADVDSTRQEAQVLAGCIRDRKWTAVAIVTSDYHTRRAGMIWRRVVGQVGAGIRLWIEGVNDPEFSQPWWKHRQGAKVFVMESVKLVSAYFGG